MTAYDLTQPEKLYVKLEMTTAENCVAQKKDLAFLNGRQLDDMFEDVFIHKAEPTSLEIYWDNFGEDGTVSLRTGVHLSIRVGNDKDNLVHEDATLWLTTDGRITDMCVTDIAGTQYLEFEVADFAGLLSRLSPKK